MELEYFAKLAMYTRIYINIFIHYALKGYLFQDILE